jgi:hypothetical protein
MEQVIFYDWNRNPKMIWSDACRIEDEENHTIQFYASFDTTIYNARTICRVETGQLVRFIEQLEDMYKGQCNKIVLHSCDEKLSVFLQKELCGHIALCAHVKNKYPTEDELTFCTYFDQTFLPDLCAEIRIMSQTSVVQSDYTTVQPEESFSFHLSLLDRVVLHDYVCFRLNIKDAFFHVVTDTSMWWEEFHCFREELGQLIEGKVNEVIFAPLGEFWRITFVSLGREILVKGDISDMEMPQSSLSFHRIVSSALCSDLKSQLERWLL